MNEQKKQEIKECLAELSAIVDYYNPKEGYKKEIFCTIAIISFMVICLTVISEVGVLWGIILLGCGLVPLINYAVEGINSRSSDKSTISDEKLAERACILMSSCIERYKHPERDYYFLMYKYDGNNVALYQEFVSLFPHMESKKLKKLASIQLKG